ncbi:hypothetical protein FisN_20Lu209 [Fistulifera solaris]|uniref:Uncharacterized protein n=1 Tax=Fistulifera solaris TaxID=1519565 RepID=A0A1Z5KRF3_FISSO|nr:hypothetical protein FisN_20Lu209 [Fistulifera solaris]|eukprot:GAX28900.1 hypothetical protein FisN_20Lu209 [Fistulifera solaris]
MSSSTEAVMFRDDRGTVHEWDNTVKAKVAVRAGIGGVSLFHMGMTADQLVATWGIWGIRGSDFDPANPTAGSVFPELDPGPEEAAFLASAVNLSPSCYTNPRGCFQIDNVTDLVALQDQIDFVLFIDNGVDEKFLEVDAAGLTVIFVDTFYEYNENCRAFNYSLIDPSMCYGRSMIDIANRLEELAVFLGSDVDVDALNMQKQAACEAASNLTDAAAQAHEKGIRIKNIWLAVNQDENGTSYASLSDYDPIDLWVPRTLEELGMPLLHGDTYEEWGEITANQYFVDCEPGDVNQECNGNTYFPVDFWMIDSRSSRLVDDNFKLLFPDRAILADQWWYTPMNDGPLSYKIIASYLTGFTERISAAENLQEATEECTPVDPKSIAHLKADGSGGLPLNGFVCYDRNLIQEEYLKCPNFSAPAPTTDSPPTAPTPTTDSEPTAPTPSVDATTPTAGNAGSVPTSSVLAARVNSMAGTLVMVLIVAIYL